MKKISLDITGMHCASCAVNIKNSLEKAEGVQSADVNFATAKAEVNYDESKVSLEAIKENIVSGGYTIKGESQDKGHHHSEEDSKKQKHRVIASIILTIPLVIRMFWAWEVPGEIWNIAITDWIQHDLAFIIVFFFGWTFHKHAWKQIKKFQFSMDSLISLGTLTAYFYSLFVLFNNGHLYFESAAAIISLILLGKYFEVKSRGKASQAMKKLMELGVKKARVFVDNKEVEKDIDDIRVNEILVIKPSEKIPLDGVVIEGQSNVNEAMLTGESLPVFKEKDSKVFGATLNQDGLIKIKVTRIGKDTVLAQIIKTVEEAQKFKAPMQRLADKISSIFVPAVIVIAILTFVGWYLATKDLSTSIINAVAVLIIACPCALGLAAPMAVMVGTSVGAKNGILIKNGESFEKAKNIDVIVFDKTGTLTEGKPEVQKVLVNENTKFEEQRIIKIAGSLASNSEHPLSKAVAQMAEDKKIELIGLNNFKEIPGKGVMAKSQEQEINILLGNKKLLVDNNLDLTWAEQTIKQCKDSGGTLLFLAHGQEVIGGFLITDQIKASAKETIKEIKEMNLEVIMISGDNQQTAQSVAKQIGITEVVAEVLPQEKQDQVKKLQAKGKKVVFVGDGINDAPSLIQADLGISMGSGTDIAKESGNIILMKNDPLKVVQSIKLSKKTFNVIKQNMFWAFFYNIVAIPLAIAGIITPMIAAIAMSFSSISVISNSLRIYKDR
ncbi:MAG: heavy metal translocating P-type ATPase [bacterium]